MKKLVAWIGAAALLMALSGCGGGDTETAGPEAANTEPTAAPVVEPVKEPETYRIGLAAAWLESAESAQSAAELEAGLRELEAEHVHYELTVVDALNDAAAQQQQLSELVEQGMDVILLEPVEPTAATALVETVTAARIPLVLLGREPLDEGGAGNFAPLLDNAQVCYVGTGLRQRGLAQGEMVLSRADGGDVNGDGRLSYIILGGGETPSCVTYVPPILEQTGIPVDRLSPLTGLGLEDPARVLCYDTLLRYGTRLELVLCADEPAVFSALKAIETVGRVAGEDICVIGAEATEESTALALAGTIGGTLARDAAAQGRTAAQVAVKLLYGEAVEDYYWIEPVCIGAQAVE